MLEQVSNIEAVKKTPFPIDAPKSKPTSKGGAEPVPDFKSVLEKSLQAQAPKDPNVKDKIATPSLSPKASAQAAKVSAKDSTPKPTSSTPLSQAPSPAKAPSAPISAPSPLAPSHSDLGKETLSKETLSQEALTKGALSKALDSSAPKPESASPALSASSPAQATQQKKSLNDMAKLEPQETFLSKITQNASKAESSLESKSSAQAGLPESPQAGLQAGGAKLDSSAPKSATKPDSSPMDSTPESMQANAIQQALQASTLAASAQGAAQSGAQKPSAPSPAQPSTLAPSSLQDSAPKPAANTLAKPTLGDVVEKAKDLGLNPGKVEFSQQEDEFKNSVQARTGMRQASPSSDGIRQFFDKQDEASLRPLFSMISAANALDAAARRSGKAPRLEYAIESKTEKIAIINRGKTLPKNITESRLKNERQERVFEQIQKDIAAGRELDLEQIKAELFTSKDSSEPATLAKPLSPAQPAQRLAQATALAAPALVQSAQEALKESQKSSKDPKEQRSQGAKPKVGAKDSAQAQESRDVRGSKAELESSAPSNAPKDLARTLESELELADMELSQELESQELLQEKSPKVQKQAANEQKLDSKPESKLATSAALGASAMKQELSKPQVREMITSFVNQFDQEVKKFKPPMNKISLELNPKELGSIELTITQRGNNLHISVVSNPQAITLFAQNQLELRQNLVAQGFDGVDLSFSQDSSGGFSGNGSGEQSRESPQDGLESGLAYAPKDSSEPSMEITLPLYA